jgi:dihydroorotase
MNPPLRDVRDRDEMIRGLVDGSIDVLATDHAPHHQDEKGVEFDRAPFGIVGLETAAALTFDRLVHPGLITMRRFVELWSVNPARVLGVPGGSLSEGQPADISILAPDLSVTVDPVRFVSKGRNTPFGGWTLRGGVAATIVGGRVVYSNPAVASVQALAEPARSL